MKSLSANSKERHWSGASKMSAIQTKVALSNDLEREIFQKAPLKRELLALKERCESYQIGRANDWSGNLMPAYSQYFGFLTALKVKSVLLELDSYGYLENFRKNAFHLVDFGAGTLGASLGAQDFFKGSDDFEISRITAIDRESKPIEWAQDKYRNFFQSRIGIERNLSPQFPQPNTLFIAVDVLNEMGLMGQEPVENWAGVFLRAFEKADPSTLFIFIEPANKIINRKFLEWRNFVSSRIPILLPCTHCLTCPALAKDSDWCHEDRDYRAPSVFWNLVHSMGFQRGSLNFSLLVLGKQGSRFGLETARVVSRKLNSKGKCEKWLCGNGKRWKESLLNRHRSPENEVFFEAQRGDILISTPESPHSNSTP